MLPLLEIIGLLHTQFTYSFDLSFLTQQAFVEYFSLSDTILCISP